jgi:DNA polymerase-3 subunit epsilon
VGISFTAIDFETANSVWGSVCAVGLVKVSDGAITGRYSTLIKPPEGLYDFHPINMSKHGITADDVADAPSWSQILPEIMAFAGEDTLVAHNAGFDLGALRQACDWTGLEYPDLKYMCTLVMSRAVYDFPVHKLNWLVHELGLDPFEHHDAVQDAHACAQICLDIAARTGSATMDELAEATGTLVGTISPDGWRGATKLRASSPKGNRTRSSSTSPKASEIEVNAAADPDGALYGSVICFTGTLQTMSRDQAWALVGARGGKPSKGVTQKTTILVNADFDPSNVQPDEAYTNKMRRAIDLARQGQRIEVVNETEFLEMLAISDEEAAQSRPASTPSRRSLPDHVVTTSRRLNQENMDHFAWQDSVLKHPNGRAAAGDTCCYCDGIIPDKVPWKIRDRGLCGSRCNQLLMRAAKRLWQSESIGILTSPAQAENGFLVTAEFPRKRVTGPRVLSTRGAGDFPYEFDRYPLIGDVVERHGHRTEYLELNDPRLPAGAAAYGRELAEDHAFDASLMVAVVHTNSGAIGYAKITSNGTPDRVYLSGVFLNGDVLRIPHGQPVSGTGTTLDGISFHTEFISHVEDGVKYRWEAQVWTPLTQASLWTPERMAVSRNTAKRKRQMTVSYAARSMGAGADGHLQVVYSIHGWTCHFCGTEISPQLVWPDPSAPSLSATSAPKDGSLNIGDLRPSHWKCAMDEGSTGTLPRILSEA